MSNLILRVRIGKKEKIAYYLAEISFKISCMAIYDFPDPEHCTDEDGLIGFGNDLSLENLIHAYSKGIFPWPVEEVKDIPWFSPDPRGILEFSDLHIPTRFAREIKKKKLKCVINKNFRNTISHCSKVKRGGNNSTWITTPMIEAYIRLHQAGIAHSIEVYDENECVGGLYGIYLNGVFTGESMFSLEKNASKTALLFLIDELKKIGLKWIDTQMVSPVLAQFGAKEIPRKKFILKLEEARDSSLPRLWVHK